MACEVEVKIAVASPALARRRIRDAGFQVHVPRVFEANTLYDFPGHRLRGEGKIVRLRSAGKSAKLTFKGKSADTRHKVREEIESGLENAEALDRVFRELGLEPSFRYEKYRTEYSQGKSRGVVTLDETPIGTFLEIEGSPQWIDRTARRLGFSPDDYIVESYGALYLRHCLERGITPSNMVFGARGGKR